ncbi:nSTAND3 domain-containing NTPase [Actinomadura opuntiae]|uniref:nSTAND3 domain-containing NTPase n=1 Tax=Actinomadura sp. OS1-43 TaxID=604315 RepID=UPI00255AFB12|nr:restriction endonuclease [Actinomadura sp. OS1-43]MDL4820137.1 restriction endonuclease [Actinomadura sp. OS1-43]
MTWRDFQDLCVAILRHVWGQSVASFADSNDGGRDGVFYGSWDNSRHDEPNENIPAAPFVIQCKHSQSEGSTLSFSALENEFEKIRLLVTQEMCSTYVLMTNARVSGVSEGRIRKRIKECGVEHLFIFDSQWICDTIASHRTLRTFVPRVYGLGDLSQILEDRACEQAKMLMTSAAGQISTFVVTDAFRKANTALRNHGFVLLLGEPAVGKSVNALMLAMGAIDEWDCIVVRVRTSRDIVNHWNPHEGGQLFLVDDAFGVVRHEDNLTRDWSRDMPAIMAAIDAGARVILTSRDYIYREARPQLKTYAYPLLEEQQIVIDVANISKSERRQIVYNHLKAGDQPRDVRAAMKPYLEVAADTEPFRPEAARRLGLQAFTRNLEVSRRGLELFMAHPGQFLSEVYSQLNADAQAALTLIYVSSSGSLGGPIELDAARRSLLEQIGSTLAGVNRALAVLDGPFVKQAWQSDGRPLWSFKHPTLREGFAAWLALQHHLLINVLFGMDDNVLLERTDCLTPGEEERPGTLLRIPAFLYDEVSQRLANMFEKWPGGSCWTHDALFYLWRDCSDEMLESFLNVHPQVLDRIIVFEPYCEFVPEPRVLARFHRAGLISDEVREAAIRRMADLAVKVIDPAWVRSECWEWDVLLKDEDRSRLFWLVRNLLLPRLEEALEEGWADDVFWRGEEGLTGDFGVDDALHAYSSAFRNIGEIEIADRFAKAVDLNRMKSHGVHKFRSEVLRSPSDGTTSASIFDDIDG